MLIRRSLRKIILGGLVAAAMAFGGAYAWGNVHWEQVVTSGTGPHDALLATIGGETGDPDRMD